MNRYIVFLLLVYSTHTWADCPSTDPEKTLGCYFYAVDIQDELAIANLFLDFPGYQFNFTENTKRDIYKKLTLAKNLVEPMPNGKVPNCAQKGNKEIWVKETYSSWSHMVSFYLKQKQGKWYVVGY